MTNFFSRPTHRLARPLAALGLLLATAGAAQAQTLTIQGTGGSNTNNDVTAFVDKVEIVRVLDGTVVTGALANASFETFSSLSAGNYGYVTGGIWTFNNNAGIETNGSNFGAPTAPDGTHAAYIQNYSGSPSGNYIAQPLTLSAGTYQVRFQVAQRNCCSGVYDQGLTVNVGGTQVGALTPTNTTAFASYTSNAFTVNGSGAVTTNNALAFDGTDDYVALPTTTPVPVGNSAYTIEAWIKPTSMNVYGIVGWGNYGTNNQVNALRLDPANGGSIRNYWWSNDLGVTVGDLSGQWHHVAATFDGTTRRIYLDGVLKGSDTPSGHNVPNANSLRIGSTNVATSGNAGGTGEYFPGGIDEVRIYNVGLTQAQVQADMFSASGAAAVPASQKYYANFDQGTAGGTNAGLTSLTDQSGNGNTGTLTNFALTGTASNWVRSFPTITGISPSTGPAGTSLTLTGTNLTDATGFAFNGTGAVQTTPTNDLTATISVPGGSTTGPVSTASATLAKYNGPVFTVTGASASTNNALAFDGGTAYVSYPSTTTAVNNLGTSAYTLETWVYYDGTRFTNSLIRKSIDYNLYINNGRLGAEAWTIGGGNSAFTTATGSATLPTNRWLHVAATWNKTSNTFRLYVNGVLDAGATVTTGTASGVENLNIGYSTAYPGQDLSGKLDELRIYSTDLTAAQVQADMFSTTSAVPASLGLYLNFNQGTAGGNNAGITTVTDQSSNGYVGTLNNFALTGTATNFVRSFPTITGISPTSGAAGASVSVTGTNLTDATSFAFNGAAVSPFTTPTSDLTATVTVPASASTGPVSVASATLTKYNGPVFTFLAGDLVVSTTMTIPPATYNNITVTGPNGNGTLGGDVVVNGALVVQSGGTLSDGCNIFTGTGTFTLAAGGTLSICRPRGILAVGDAQGNIGAVRVTGGRSFSNDASYIYNGSDATGSGMPSQVRNLSITVPGDVALTQPTSVVQALTLSSSGNLVLGSQALTLLSSATGTALVVNSSTGVVNGTATVQRYISSANAGAGYRHYSSPVSNTTVGDLATAGFAPTLTTSYNASATPGTTTPFPTVFGYDQSRVTLANSYVPFDRGFVVPASTGTALAVGQGYAVNIDGTQLVDFVGTLNNGPQTLPLSRVAGNADAGWQLLGNPYPAPLDYALIAAGDRPNLDAAMYVYSSSAQYTGTYRSYVNGVGPSSIIPLGQGFFTRVSTGQTSGSITFRNAQRLTAPNATAFQRTTTDTRPLVQLELRGTTGPADVLYAYAQAGATSAFDSQFDAEKLANPTGLNLSSTATSGQRLAIDGHPVFDATTVLPLAVGVPAAGSYTFSAVALNNLPAGLDAYLNDAQTGQAVRLSTQPSYTFSVTTAQAAALLVGRFTLTFAARTALATAPALTAAQVALYPNPAHARFTVLMPGVTGATAVQAELVNALGQVVRRQSAALPPSGSTLTVETAELAAGVYTLRLLAGPTTVAKRVVLQ